MANSMTPEDFERYLDRMEEQLRDGYITHKEYNDAVKDAKIGIRGYTAELQSAQKKLGMSALTLGKDMMSGKQGVSVFGGAAEAGADAVASYTKKFGPAGRAVGLFTQALTRFVTASLKQSDQLFESFQKISQTGAVGAGAMSEVFDNMLKFGYTVDQLGNLGDLLARNSKDFGVFFASALKGSRAFSEVADQVQNSGLRQQLFNLGLTVDDINDGIAGFINQQGKLGQVQGRTTDQLRMGAEAYIKELDILTKLTGMTRKEQEEAREQALQIKEFYAGLQDLGPEAQEQALQAFTMAFARGGPKLAGEMASQFNGFITGASDLFLTTGGSSMQAFSKDFFARGGTAAQSFQMLRDSISPEVIQITKGLNQFGASLGVDLRPLMMLTQNSDNLQSSLDQLTDEQYKLLTGTDRATAAQSKTRDAQIKTTQNLQEFVNLGVKPATVALEYFTEALEYLTTWIPGAGSAKKRREEATARKAGKETATTRAEAAYQANVAALGNEMGSFGMGGTTGSGSFEGYLEKMVKAESGGRNIGNLEGTSSAFGLAQITKGTFEDLAAKAGVNNPLYGKTFDDMKADTKLQMEAAQQLTDQNRQFLASRKLPTSDAALYLAHFLGAGGAARALSAPGASPISSVVSPEQLSANKMLREMTTVADLKSWANNKMGGGGYEFGGIVSGPKSGYQALLHGTEAVVPLPNGRNIPVEVTSQDNGMLTAQLDKLDELIRIMQNQVSVSTKILQASS